MRWGGCPTTVSATRASGKVEMTDIWVPLVLTALAGLATSIGGVIGVLGRGDSRRLMSVGLGFSAGVMIYVSLVEILPKGRESLIAESVSYTHLTLPTSDLV